MIAGKHVIVGGLGNLGMHMQRALLARGVPISVIDRGEGGTRLVDKSINFIPHRLGLDDPQALREALRGADTVYSMVTPDVQHGTKSDFVNTNEVGASHLVDACRAAGVHKLVYASSIAVTNHFMPSIDQNEDDPLPDLDTYISAYDITKRKGESKVIQASDSNFHSCALRLGAVLAGPTDYNFRQALSSPGRVVTVPMERIDHISAKDVCKAMIKASEKMDASDCDVSGKAIFLTKCRTGSAPRTNEVAEALAEFLEWQLMTIPSPAVSVIRAATWAKHTLSDIPAQDEGSKVGIPPHLFMDISQYQQTFDNTLARTLLDFEPDETWKDAVEWIVEDYKSQQVRG